MATISPSRVTRPIFYVVYPKKPFGKKLPPDYDVPAHGKNADQEGKKSCGICV
jgi:hypothetical protein